MSDVAKIAEGLSGNARKALLNTSSKRWKSMATIKRHAKLGEWPRGMTRFGLFEADCTRGWTTLYRLSKDGLAVREHLVRMGELVMRRWLA